MADQRLQLQQKSMPNDINQGLGSTQQQGDRSFSQSVEPVNCISEEATVEISHGHCCRDGFPSRDVATEQSSRGYNLQTKVMSLRSSPLG